ncbi:MAG: sensor histidine kinase [Ktedonobacteraceae bacterium]
MHRLQSLPHLLLGLPWKVRLGIVAPCFLLCAILFIRAFPSLFNGSLFAIPVGLAVWLFKWRGASISIGATILIISIVNSFAVGSFFWPSFVLTGFLAGVAGLLFEGLVIGSLRSALDVADAAQKRARQAEEQQAIAYEQRIAALQAEQRMTIAYEQQRQLNRLKDQFILNVNHELRTPLTELFGYLELLSEFDGSIDASTQTTFLQQALESCKELIYLTNHVLEATKVAEQAQPPQREELSIAQVVREVLTHFDPRKQAEYQIQLDIPEHLTVYANSQYLHQVLRNLLSNAFKYTPQQTLILISASQVDPATQSAHTRGEVCISVKDAGPGIPPSELPLLFGKFVRLQRDLSGTIRGSGLGLYISKQLVETMDGRIWAESSGIAGEGSRFCFTLPTTLPSSTTPEPDASTTGALAP